MIRWGSSAAETQVSGVFRPVGIFLVISTGLVHLIAAPDHYEEATYIGVLFSANLLGACVAALGIYRDNLWGWVLGTLVTGGALAMFVVSRLNGLPDYDEHVGVWLGDSLEDYLGLPSLVVEALFVALFVVVIASWTRGAPAVAREEHDGTSTGPSSLRRERLGTVLIILAGALLFVGHLLHLMFFSGP